MSGTVKLVLDILVIASNVVVKIIDEIRKANDSD